LRHEDKGVDIELMPSRLVKFFVSDRLRASVFLYAFLLWFVFSQVTTSGVGLNYVPQKLIWYPVQILLLTFVAATLPIHVNGPVEILQVLTSIFLTIPMVVISFSNTSNIRLGVSILALIYVLFNQVLFRLLSLYFPPSFKTKTLRIKTPSVSIAFFAFLTFTCLGLVIIDGNLNFRLSSLNNLYLNRELFRESLEGSDILRPYLFGWLGGALVPILISLGLAFRRKVLFLFGIFTAIFVYTTASQKWVLGGVMFLMFLYFLKSRVNDRTLQSLDVIKFFNILIGFLLMLQMAFGNSRALDLGVRRAILDPSVMVQFYTKFSLENNLPFWSESRVSQLLFNSSSQALSEIIGEKYFFIPRPLFIERPATMNATSGVLGDSIAQAGFIGVIAMGVLLYFFFYFLHYLSQNKSDVAVFLVSAFAVQMVIEGTLHTQFLSKGLMLVPLLLTLIPSIKKNSSYHQSL
jgi:hypothetical protein